MEHMKRRETAKTKHMQTLPKLKQQSDKKLFETLQLAVIMREKNRGNIKLYWNSL